MTPPLPSRVEEALISEEGAKVTVCERSLATIFEREPFTFCTKVTPEVPMSIEPPSFVPFDETLARSATVIALP